jgi:hypothetical protein
MAHSVDWLRLAKVNHHPLRALVIRIAGVALIEIRITFPESRIVAVVQPRITIVFSFTRKCPLLALSGRANRADECPL